MSGMTSNSPRNNKTGRGLRGKLNRLFGALSDRTRQSASEAVLAGPGLPLVSVVIINFNNADYLEACLASVQRQTYRNIECVIVDDNSNDNSGDVLRRIGRRNPEIRIIRNQSERFQTICGYIGYKETRGDFVIFLDADDYLMPECVEMHIYAHLSSVAAIGFTVCESLQASNNSVIRQNYTFFSTYVDNFVKSNRDLLDFIVKPVEKYAPRVWTYRSHYYERFKENIALVNYGYDNLNDHRFYVTATSSNCFRRDAIKFLFSREPASSMLETKGSLDNFLICGVWLFSASLVINYPLVVRRIHSGSITGSVGVHAELMGYGVSLDRIIGIAQTKVFRALVEALIDGAATLLTMASGEVYVTGLLKLDQFIKGYCRLNRYADELIDGSGFLRSAVLAAQDHLAAALGEKNFNALEEGLA